MFEFRVIKNGMRKRNKNEKEKKGEQLDKKYLNFSLINRFKDIDFTNTTKTIQDSIEFIILNQKCHFGEES